MCSVLGLWASYKPNRPTPYIASALLAMYQIAACVILFVMLGECKVTSCRGIVPRRLFSLFLNCLVLLQSATINTHACVSGSYQYLLPSIIVRTIFGFDIVFLLCQVVTAVLLGVVYVNGWRAKSRSGPSSSKQLPLYQVSSD